MNKLLTAVLLSSVITLSVQAQKAEEYYVKHVEFPPNATLEQKVDIDRKSTRLNSSHNRESRMPSSA